MEDKEYIFINEKHLNLLEQNISTYDVQAFDAPDEMFHKFGCSPHGIEGTVDLNKFLQCFPNLKLKSGYALDYVYDGDDISVYARKNEDFPVLTTKQFKFTFPEAKTTSCSLSGLEPNLQWTAAFIDKIEFDESPESLFELSLFLCILRTIYVDKEADAYSYVIFKRFLYTKNLINKLCKTRKNPAGKEYYSDLTDVETRPYLVITENEKEIHFISESSHEGISFETIKFIDEKPTIRISEPLIWFS